MLQIQPESDLEYVVIKEWEYVQTYLFQHMLTPCDYRSCTWREKIAADIARCTRGNVQIWWEPVSSECARGNGQLRDVCALGRRYGVLKFAPGYLISALFPTLPQLFADLCAHLLSLVEQRALIQSLQRSLKPLHGRESLTRREWDVLQLMLVGASETEIARELTISLTTVRTHRHSIYQRLGVHSPHEVVLRSFDLGLGNWLDASCAPAGHGLE